MFRLGAAGANTFTGSELYHGRWGIEEAIKLLKHRLNAEPFSGELPESIRQDFHAKILTANLAWALAHSARHCKPRGGIAATCRRCAGWWRDC